MFVRNPSKTGHQQAEVFEAVLLIAGNHEFYDVQAPGAAQKPPDMSWSDFYNKQGSMKTY
jgi:hypothetical protein